MRPADREECPVATSNHPWRIDRDGMIWDRTVLLRAEWRRDGSALQIAKRFAPMLPASDRLGTG